MTDTYETVSEPVSVTCRVKLKNNWPPRFAHIEATIKPANGRAFEAVAASDDTGTDWPHLEAIMREAFEDCASDGILGVGPVDDVSMRIDRILVHHRDSDGDDFATAVRLALTEAITRAPLAIRNGNPVDVAERERHVPRFFTVTGQLAA